MSNPMKDQVAADLEKAKTVGSTRVERIRKIFQEALSQTVTELKTGTSEIGSIAKDSTSTLVGNLKENLKEKKSETAQVTTVPIEVKIEDHNEDIAETAVVEMAEPVVVEVSDVTVEIQPETEAASMDMSSTLEQPIELIEVEPVASVEPSVEPVAVVQVDPTSDKESAQNLFGTFADSLKAMAERLLRSVQDSETYAAAKQKLAVLDEKLTARYGTRYETFKQEFNQDIAKAKVWYENTKAENAATGTNWVEQKQSELEVKMGETGATIAQKEQKIKQLLKELWLTVSKF